MSKIRNSIFVKYLCFFLMLSIATMSCEQQGHIISSAIIDDKVASQLNSLSVSAEDCAKMRDIGTALKNFVFNNHNNGIVVTEAQTVDYALTYSEQKGYITAVNKEMRQDILRVLKDVHYVSANDSYKPLITISQDKGYITPLLAEVLKGFEDRVRAAKDKAEIGLAIQETETIASQLVFSTKERDALAQSLTNVKRILCADMDSQWLLGGNTNLKEDCLADCLEQSTLQQRLLIAAIVPILFFILLIPVLNLAVWVAAAIAMAVFILVWTIKCVRFCSSPSYCPKPTCRGQFILDDEGRLCINPNLPNDAVIFGDCIYSPRSNGVCPNSTTPQGSMCLWECFSPAPEDFGVRTGRISFRPDCN